MRTVLFILLSSLSSLVPAAEPKPEQTNQSLSFQSPVDQVPLIELYTSQGCSSCPPADNWLSQFKDEDRLWEQIVPIAFHVDYWDWIGWTDPLANSKNTERQKYYYKIGNLRSVYTPGLVLNGHEWKIRQGLPKERAKPGILKGTIQDSTLSVTFSPSSKIDADSGLVVHTALLGFDIEVDVSRGENKNRRLKHDFVLLDHQASISKTQEWKIQLPELDQHREHAKRFGLAIWLTTRGDPAPLQATGTWL